MKLLKERQEIAMAINFRKYPVLKIDLADADEYGLKGCKVGINAGTFRNGLPRTVDAVLRVYRDEKKLTTASYGTCISDSFGYSDYTKIVENAQAPLIGPDQDVVIAIYDSRTKRAFAPMIVHTEKRVEPLCSTPLGFEVVDMTQYLVMAGCELKEVIQ